MAQTAADAPQVPGDAPAVTPPAPETTAAAQPAVSPQLAAIARREKAVRDAQLALEREREELKVQRSKYETEYIPKTALKSDYMKLLSEAGITYDDIVAKVMNMTPPSPHDEKIAALEAKIAELEGKTTQSVTKLENFQSEQYKAALDNLKTEAVAKVDAAGTDFELVKATNSFDAVVELIRTTFEDEKRLMPVEEALKLVEDHLLEETMKFAQVSKIKAKLLPPVKEDAAVPAQTPSAGVQAAKISPTQPIKTLTNAASATSSTAGLTAQQRRERAIMAFKGELQ